MSEPTPSGRDAAQRVRRELARAHRALKSAYTLLPDDPAGAANRTYYAAFHAARAALYAAGEVPRTHTGIERRFALHFVRSGRIAPEVGRALGSAEELRFLADYDEGADIAPADVRAVLAEVERFVGAVETILTPQPPDE